jgi:hypothetical protein
MEIELDKKYGILLSGGLDSAVLLYVILKQQPLINLQPFTIPKHDGSALYADPVIDYINKELSVELPKTKYVGNPDARHEDQSSIAIREIFLQHSIDYLFMGVNTNPPELDTLEGAPKRKLVPPSKKLIYPFATMLKDKIIQIMFEENQQELMNITHSCTEQKQGRCNRCWQCTERAWAFRQLNKIDTGTL